MQEFDLFTFIAAIVNFLVLVVLLRIFLYKRVIKAVEERRKRIENRWNEAETAREDARRSEESYQKKTRELKQNEQEIREEARRKAAEKREELINRAKQEVGDRKEEWIDSLEREKDRIIRRFREQAAGDLMTALRRIFEDLADTELEQAVIDRFLGRLDRDSADSLSGDGAILVRTGFSLTEARREYLVRGMEEQTGLDLGDRDFTFETDEVLVCGIEVEAQSKKISLNVDKYLQEASEELSKQLRV